MTAPGDARKMSCEEFDALLPELIGSGDDINRHPHIQDCELHRAFVADLVAIAEAARQLFPTMEEEPPDELWNRLDEAIKKDETPAEKEKGEEPGLAASGDDPSKSK